MTLDASGNIYATGTIDNTVDLDPGAGTYIPSSKGGGDVYILKLDGSGNYLMGIRFGGNNYEHGRAIALNSTGNIVIAGNFGGTADFDAGPGTYNLSSAGGDDMFLGMYSQTIILPVSLENFSASLNSAKQVKLSWNTSLEKNASTFIIERSLDGSNYKFIGQVAATGNSSSSNEYDFLDADPQQVNIYRLKMVDADGNFQYSKTLLIKLGESKSSLKISPNPSSNILQLQTRMKGALSVNIYDVSGQLVKTLQAKNSGVYLSTILDIENLATGIYHLELSNGKEVERTRFIKN